MKKYKIGSLFSGIGGFELGLERAIPAETIWQVEQDEYCQKVLKKHWPKARIYNDVRDINKETVEPVDILCGGFPCQDISIAGKGEGLNGKKSGLYWEMFRIIRDLRPRVIVMENVPAITFRGGVSVIGSLASIGYISEWTVISAGRNFGAPHLRRRWFCVSYSNCKSKSASSRYDEALERLPSYSSSARAQTRLSEETRREEGKAEEPYYSSHRPAGRKRESYWAAESGICRVVNGLPNRTHRLRALGNAIVPQCSQWVGEQIWNSGILQRE